MKVLLVEDDPLICALITNGLERMGFSCDNAVSSATGEMLALSKKYDVIIMDIILPGISGLELCRKIRDHNILTPVIMLTSLDSLEDKLRGFESGADDYMIKPFSFQELLARIKVWSRRTNGENVNPVLKALDLELDSVAKKVRRNGKVITLTATEYRILELFLRNKGRVFDRIHIAEKISGLPVNSGTNIIDVHINSLRNKIDKDFSHKLIHTKKGFGYFLSEDHQH